MMPIKTVCGPPWCRSAPALNRIFGIPSQLTRSIVRESLSKEQEAKDVFSQEDEEKVKERLKALGYID